MFQAPHQMDLDTKMALELPKQVTLIDLDEIKRMNIAMDNVREMLVRGIALAPKWANKLIQETVEDRLRFRYCYHTWNCWCVDRWCDAPFNCWMVVYKHVEEDGRTALPLNEIEVQRIIMKLREGDTKGKTGEELLAEKRAKAAEIAKAREAALDDNIAERIDNLSTKSLDTVKDALEALQTGGKITAHGDDERFLEHSYEETRKAAAAGVLTADDPRLCVNPGQNPTRSN